MKRECLNNKGFSLMELLIVLAVTAIAITIMGLSMSYINRTNAQKACKDFVALYKEARTESMAKGPDYKFLINVKDGKLVGKIGVDGEEREICNLSSIEFSKLSFRFTGPYDDDSAKTLYGHIDNAVFSKDSSAGFGFEFNSAGMIVRTTRGNGEVISTGACRGGGIFWFKRDNRIQYAYVSFNTGKISSGVFYN